MSGTATAPINPWASFGSAALGTAAGGPSSADARSNGTVGGDMFDNSGWNVTFGNNSGIKAERSEPQPMDKTMQYLLIGGALLVAVVWLKKKG